MQSNSALNLRRSLGFTLIEVMVVIAIIAIMVGAVVLNIDFQNVSTVVRDTSQRTRLVMNLASDQAIYSRQQFGIRFHPHSYEFYMLTADEKSGEGVWEMIEDDRLKFKEIPIELDFQVDISGVPIVLESLEDEVAGATEESPIKPHVMFLSNGEMMPDFRIVIADKSGENRHAIATGEVEPVVVEDLNE